jgi:acyl transferase domain-containing protein/3-hydroxymyristoyl/3-hydroxydecanoyl-(acyl carrier protein) dehydratase
MEKLAIIGSGALFPGNNGKKAFFNKLIANETFTVLESYNNKTIERGKVDAIGPFEELGIHDSDSLSDIYKWTYMVCREALEESGYINNDTVLNRTGLIMGSLFTPIAKDLGLIRTYLKEDNENIIKALLEDDHFNLDLSWGERNSYSKDYYSFTQPTASIANVLKLNGPIVSFNAACATPLYAIRLASLYLTSRKADLMIVGSHCYNDSFYSSCALFDILGVLCENGRSKPFDKTSEGLIIGSGAGAFAVKRLCDVEKDKDNVLAVVDSIGWGNDGGANALLAPGIDGQIRAYEDAYKEEISPDVDYIECHATGTKAGDLAELNSLSHFFKSKGVKPLIGATKGNTGHFFTASAHASILKIIYAMKHNLIPATVRIAAPLSSSDNYLNGDALVLKNIPWPRKRRRKRAAINAFGFGGINAHLVLSEYDEQNKTKAIRLPTISSLAIVGMALHIGEIDSLQKFHKALLSGKKTSNATNEKRWGNKEQEHEFMKAIGLHDLPKGAFVNSINFDFLKFRLPPKDDMYFCRKDLLLLSVAEKALNDAQINPGDVRRTAVIVNISQDYSDFKFQSSFQLQEQLYDSLKRSYSTLNERQIREIIRILIESDRLRDNPDSASGLIANIKANRISSHWKFEGPSFIIAERENSFARSLELSRFILSEQLANCVVLGTIELAGELSHLFVLKELNLIEKVRKTGIGEGATVIVLKRKEDALKNDDRIYAYINGVSLSSGKEQNKENKSEIISSVINNAYEEAAVKATEIGCVELPDSLYDEDNVMVKEHLNKGGAPENSNYFFKYHSIENLFGFTFSLKSPLAVIKSALSLYYKLHYPEHYGENVSPWFTDGVSRKASVFASTIDGNFSHIALTESNEVSQREQLSENISYFIFPICGSTIGAIKSQLAELTSDSHHYDDISKIFKITHDRFHRDQPLTLALVASTKEELIQECKLAETAIEKSMNENTDWISASGSYFSPRPLGPSGIVFMSPPGGMVHNTLVAEIVNIFPDLRHRVEKDFKQHMKETIRQNGKIMQKLFLSNISKYIFEFSIISMLTCIVKDKLKIKPRFVMGASFGELGLPHALDSFDVNQSDNEKAVSVVDSIKLFTELSDERDIFTGYFKAPINDWQCWYLHKDKNVLSRLVEKEEKVFITIVGSPNDVVISGEAESCQKILSQVGGFHLLLDDNSPVHTPIAEQYWDRMYALMKETNISLKKQLPYKVYSTFNQKELSADTEDLARNITNIFTKPVNFQKVTEKVYDDGGRIFINIGTHAILSGWIKETLKGKNILVLGSFGERIPCEIGITRLLAALLAHGVPVDYGSLYQKVLTKRDNTRSFIKSVPMGLPHHDEYIATEKNKAYLKKLKKENVIIESREKAKYRVSEDIDCFTEKTSERPLYKKIIFHTVRQNAIAFQLYQNAEKNLFALSPLALSLTVKNLKRNYLWSYDEVLEMTQGSVSKVLGKRYKEMDQYEIHARMPSPPLLFVSRITNINAEFQIFRPSSIEIEYDITNENIFAFGDEVSSVVYAESAHIGIFLVGYIGIDIISHGKLRYRVADSKMTFKGALPKIGETLRGIYKINSFAKTGNTMLLFYSYDCYVGNRIFLTIEGIGGFFNENDLTHAKGFRKTELKNKNQEKIVGAPIAYLTCLKTSFSAVDLEAYFNGHFTECFSSSDFSNSWFKVKEEVRMIDRIPTVDLTGGDYNLGIIVGEKDIYPDHWAFKAHFKNDPVLPGILMIEGLNQLLNFYIIYNGWHIKYAGKKIGSPLGIPTSTVFRGQVEKSQSLLTYRLHIKEIVASDHFKIKVNSEVIWRDKIIITTENILTI